MCPLKSVSTMLAGGMLGRSGGDGCDRDGGGDSGSRGSGCGDDHCYYAPPGSGENSGSAGEWNGKGGGSGGNVSNVISCGGADKSCDVYDDDEGENDFDDDSPVDDVRSRDDGEGVKCGDRGKKSDDGLDRGSEKRGTDDTVGNSDDFESHGNNTSEYRSVRQKEGCISGPIGRAKTVMTWNVQCMFQLLCMVVMVMVMEGKPVKNEMAEGKLMANCFNHAVLLFIATSYLTSSHPFIFHCFRVI